MILTITHFNFVEGAPANISVQLPGLDIPLAINDLSLMFLVLVSTLMPAVIILTDLDHNPRAHKYIVALLCAYLVTSLLLLTTDILALYVLYELLIFVIFFVMYLSTNARGCVEASLFFLG